MSLLTKTHKPLKPNGDPATRPVVGASKCTNGPLGDVGCHILDAVTQANGGTSRESMSSQDVLFHIEEVTKTIDKKGSEVVFSSMDAIALYPEIKIRAAAAEMGGQWRSLRLSSVELTTGTRPGTLQ